MLFSEPSFMFFFLPAVLLAYFVLWRGHRDLVLLGFSLVFYAWGERLYVLVLCLSILLNWVCGRLAGRSDGVVPRRAVVAAGVGNLLLLIGVKYTNFLVENVN